MNLEAINKWLDEEYDCSYTRLEELHNFYFEKYCDLQQENKILKENAENNDKVVDKVNWENQLLKKENKQLKEQLLVTQTNEETFRLEMEDITQTLGLDEDTIFDDVKAYARSLKDNWNKLKEYIRKNIIYDDVGMKILDPSPLEDYMQKLEQGSDK